MKVLLVPLILLLLVACQPVAGLDNPIPVPPNVLAPTDPDGDGKYEDLNGNNRQDFADVVLFFNQMTWIATNQPVHLFDFNGNARIDFADVVSLFNDMGSSPPPARVVLSATVAPSDEDRVLRGDGVNLTVPGGALNQTSAVRVATVASPPAPPEGTSNLTVYDITVGTQVRFMPGLVIEIPYTSSMIPPGKTPARVFQGIRWDEGTGGWREIPTAVDTARGVVVLETDHLCVAGYTAKLAPAPVTEIYSSPFVIHFDPSDDAAIAAAWKGSGNLTTAHDMAYRVKYALDDAYDLYVTHGGFKEPVRSRFSHDNYIHVYVGDYYESEWHQFTKTITISREPFTYGPGAPERLDEELRHELFHAVQNAYVGTVWLYSNRWWTEATAEYAATGLYTGTTSPSFPLDDAFFTKPLATVDKEHEYQAAHFVEALDERGGDFRSVWEATTSDTDAYYAVQDWCEERGSPLGSVYEDLMAHSRLLELTWVGDTGYYLVRPSVLGVAGQLGETNVIPCALQGWGTGTVSAAFRVSTMEDSVVLLETLQSGESTLPGDCHVTRYHVWPSGNHKTDHFPYGADSDSFAPSSYLASDGDTIVYTIASGAYSFNDAIILTTPEARIEPELTEVAAGGAVEFTVSIENIPSGVPVQVVDSSGKVMAAGTGSASLRFSEQFPYPGNYIREYRVKTVDWRWSEKLTSHVVVVEST